MASKRSPATAMDTSMSKRRRISLEPTSSTQPANKVIRFSSTSPPPKTENATVSPSKIQLQPTSEAPQKQLRSPDLADDEDSDDDAPEAVSAATAAAQVKAAAAEQTQTKERARKEQREKRREKEEEQKARARKREIKEKRKERKKAKANANTVLEDDEDDLPARLPESLLADETLFDRPPTPEVEDKPKKAKNETRRSQRVNLDAKEKKRKDLKKGDVIVSVLKSESSFLPPKASKESQNMRSQWLEMNRQAHEQTRLGLTLKQMTGKRKALRAN